MKFPSNPAKLSKLLNEHIILMHDSDVTIRLESQLHELGHIATLRPDNQDDLLSSLSEEHHVGGAINNEGKQDSAHHECLASAIAILIAREVCPSAAQAIQAYAEGNLRMNTPKAFTFRGTPVRGSADPVGYMNKLLVSPATQKRAHRIMKKVLSALEESLEG